MKKIYSLEVTLSLCCLTLLIPSPCGYATPHPMSRSLAKGDVPYQTYRDFATNRGPFYPGAKEIPIYNKYKRTIGLLNIAPMPDFSSVSNTTGIATIIHPQYATTVYHNPDSYLETTYFGHSPYRLAARESIAQKDFSVVRLDKVVTEAIPAGILPEEVPIEALSNRERFPLFYRVGSGRQSVIDSYGERIDLQSAYKYLTGGTIGQPHVKAFDLLRINSGAISHPDNGPLASHGAPGDSGSPLYAWDSWRQKWAVVGALSLLYHGRVEQTAYAFVNPQFIRQTIEKYISASIVSRDSNEAFVWRFDAASGRGTLGNQYTHYATQGKDASGSQSAKDLIFSGAGGRITLEESVDQGAGSITFNSDYTLAPKDKQTWRGGGVNIAKGTSVNWQVNGVAGDDLHKIGEGTLNVNASGINPGGLNVGDGTVLLAQRPDAQGNLKAFSALRIVSGRPMVILGDGKQIDPDTVTWGYRGGRLDVNGNDLTFHKLNAEDYGAALINRAPTRANITLSEQRPFDAFSTAEWSYSRYGQVGEVYGYRNSNTRTVDYFILKTPEYEWFPTDQRSNAHWEFIGHDRAQALRTRYERHKAEDTLFHGQLNGNLNIHHQVLAETRGALILDGSVDISGDFTQRNGHLVFQGHPVLHAYNTPEMVEKLRALGDNSLRTEPVSFSQPDWERRHFKVNRLVLDHALFDLARNATLEGNIEARGSTITLGSPFPYIDRNDGNGTMNVVQRGASYDSKEADASHYQGHISLSAGSELIIREKFTGSISGQQSWVTLQSRHASLTGFSQFDRTPLTLEHNAKVTATGGWNSNANVTVGPAATLQLAATPVASGQVAPSIYTLKPGATWQLKEGSALTVSPFAILQGRMEGAGSTTVRFGEGDDNRLAERLSPDQQSTVNRFSGFRSSWRGSITAPRGRLSLTSTRWELRGDSAVDSLVTSRSLIGLSGGQQRFNTLKVGTLTANETGFALRTDLKSSDRMEISQHASGRNNILFLDVITPLKPAGSLHLPLVTAPRETPASLLTVAKPMRGFNQFEPIIERKEDAQQTRWILTGFRRMPDPAAVGAARRFLAMNYKRLITEINNLNTRAAQLRGREDREGAWARSYNGGGAASMGFTDSYNAIESGIDRKTRWSGVDLYSGIVMTHASHQVKGDALRGNTRAFGAGYYLAAMSESGAYLDLSARYIRNFDRYQAGFRGLDARDYTTHSWLGGIESGYRYQLTDDLYVEPQAQLMLSKLSGNAMTWRDGGIDLAVRRKSATPLVGRSGIVAGKAFGGKNWAVTTRAGLHYQFDLHSTGNMVLQDPAGKTRVGATRDGRMLLQASLQGQVNDRVHVALEVARSAFGKVGADQAINAQLRYTF